MKDSLDDKALVAKKYFELINYSNTELYGRLKPFVQEVQPILPLIDFILDRLSAVTHLTLNDLLWDAEIVYRAALETFMKLAFIASENGDERELRIRQFWYDLAEINKLKQSEQAKKNLKGFGHIESYRLAYSPLVLTEEEERVLRGKWSRVSRQKVEQKWSFSEVMNSLAQGPMNQDSMIWGLAHCYRMASHVAHGDESGILIIKERMERSEKEKAAVTFCHFLRLFSDCLAFSIGTATYAMMFVKQDPKFFLNILDGTKDIAEIARKYEDVLYSDSVYNRFKNKV